MTIRDVGIEIRNRIRKIRNIQHIKDTLRIDWRPSAIQSVITVYGIDGVPNWWIFGYGTSTCNRDGKTLLCLGTVTCHEYNQYIDAGIV